MLALGSLHSRLRHSQESVWNHLHMKNKACTCSVEIEDRHGKKWQLSFAQIQTTHQNDCTSIITTSQTLHSSSAWSFFYFPSSSLFQSINEGLGEDF